MTDVAQSRWETKPLGDLCRIELGSTPARNNALLWDDKRQTDNVWLSIADLPQTLHGVAFDSKEYVADLATQRMRLIPKGSLLVSFKLTLGRLAYAGRDLFSNEAIASLLEIDEQVISKPFLYWALTAFDWDKAAEGDQKIKGKTLNKKKLKLIPIPLPPLEEQQRIVTVLDEAFEGLARARAHAEANLQNAQDLFESYLFTIFSEGNWPRKTLNQISENLDRVRVPITKSDRIAGDIPYYGASGVVDHVAEFLFDEELLLISEDGANLLARTYPIAFSISGKTWVNNHAHVLRFPDLDTQEFVRLYLNSISLEPYVSGMAQPKLNQAQLNRIPIPFPDHADRTKIVAKAELLAAETEDLQRRFETALQDLDDLRQSLLQKAFAGELT